MKYALENGALNYLRELLKDEKYYTEQLEDAYVMLNTCRNQRNKLEDEKQQLISFLEDKIKNLSQMTAQFINIENKVTSIPEIQIETFQEVLDFINKGGKE